MNSTTQSEGLTLVLGGTGKTGRRIVERLASRGVPTRVGSRASDPPFDWDDQSTWDAALAKTVSGASRSTPGPKAPRKVRS